MTRAKPQNRDCKRCLHTRGSHAQGKGACLAGAVGCTCSRYIDPTSDEQLCPTCHGRGYVAKRVEVDRVTA